MTKITLAHINNPDHTKTIKIDGWSWGGFFLGWIWYACHGVWGKAVLYFSLGFLLCWTIVVPVVLWFVTGAKFHADHYESLLERGYKPVVI